MRVRIGSDRMSSSRADNVGSGRRSGRKLGLLQSSFIKFTAQPLMPTLRCTRSSKRVTLTTTRACVPSPITSRSSRASTRKEMVRPSTRRDLRRRVTPQAHRRRREVAHVEVDAEALVTRRQQVLHGRERRRLDQVDHHRRGQHRDAAQSPRVAPCARVPPMSSAVPVRPRSENRAGGRSWSGIRADSPFNPP